MLPKNLGGLGILDLETFSRALRLIWLWYEWNKPDRPWVGTESPCDDIDRQLFRTSTTVTVENGTKAKFWHCSWINGRAPIDIAPNLYKLAWRKKRTVKKDLTDHSRTRGLWRMNSIEQMAEFVTLWGSGGEL